MFPSAHISAHKSVLKANGDQHLNVPMEQHPQTFSTLQLLAATATMQQSLSQKSQSSHPMHISSLVNDEPTEPEHHVSTSSMTSMLTYSRLNSLGTSAEPVSPPFTPLFSSAMHYPQDYLRSVRCLAQAKVVPSSPASRVPMHPNSAQVQSPRASRPATRQASIESVSDAGTLSQEPGKYVCHFCPKSFRRKHHVASHEVTHSTNYSFVCTIGKCKSKFRRNQDLLRHWRNVKH
ncbi:hypothetical protein BC830DRAFT_503343 [Chytriomyces sp. MP71]|nr:hypothetical protein BC830DRAFT_503343 [Chytriomyces sp. MP71]